MILHLALINKDLITLCIIRAGNKRIFTAFSWRSDIFCFCSWDEWVPESRVLRYNETNIQRQKDLLATYANKKDDKQKDTTTKKNERKRPLPSGDKV
jgi:hypothetical protein